MGISMFNSLFIGKVKSQKQKLHTCVAFFADYNQVMFDCMISFASRYCLKKPDGNYEIIASKISSIEDAWDKLKKIFTAYVNFKIELLKNEMPNLEEIYIAMDGSPCYGKIQQQMKRRKNSARYYLGDKIFFSDSMTLPGTKFSNEFAQILRDKYTKFVEETRNKDGNYRFKLTISLTDIGGEGEHKILDMLRKSSHTSYSQNSGDKCVVLYSNDSDVLISLCHQNITSVLIETKVYQGGVPEEKIVSLEDVKNIMSPDGYSLKNAPLLIAFAGNDFLPEMLNAQDLNLLWTVTNEICSHSKLELTKSVNSTAVIDFKNLELFLSYMTSIEMDMYLTGIKNKHTGAIMKPPILNGDLKNREEFAFIDIKYNYYKNFYIKYKEHSEGVKVTEVTEKELVAFEMEVALAYLKTYVWYFYYQSGYEVGKPLDNSYYKYCYPPLYNSLYILLSSKKESYFVNFCHETNKNLFPVERTSNYFERLPNFYHLHHYMVLSEIDYNAIYEETRISDPDVEKVKKAKVFSDESFPLRASSSKNPKYIDVYPFLDIFSIMEKHHTQVKANEREKSVIGTAKVVLEKRLVTGRYALTGFSAFGNIPVF